MGSTDDPVTEPAILGTTPAEPARKLAPPGAPGRRSVLVVAGRDVPIRTAVLLVGLVAWLGLMLIATGPSGVVALWTAALFVVPLVAIGSLTRTVSLRLLVWLLLMGGAAMGLAYLGGSLFTTVVRDTSAPVRDLVIPPMEEALKIAPVLFVLFRWRRAGTWSIGATDLLLMGAAAGAGFGIVEDAYIRHRFGWEGTIAALPITEIIGPRLIAGHAIWTSIAAGTIGLGLWIRSPRVLATIVAVSGIAWATLDHIRNNAAPAGRSSPSGIASLLATVTANGWLTVWILVAVVVAVIAVDSVTASRALPRRPELRAAPIGPDLASLRAWWESRVERRRLANAVWHVQRSDGPTPPDGERAARALLGSVLGGRTSAGTGTTARGGV